MKLLWKIYIFPTSYFFGKIVLKDKGCDVLHHPQVTMRSNLVQKSQKIVETVFWKRKQMIPPPLQCHFSSPRHTDTPSKIAVFLRQSDIRKSSFLGRLHPLLSCTYSSFHPWNGLIIVIIILHFNNSNNSIRTNGHISFFCGGSPKVVRDFDQAL